MSNDITVRSEDGCCRITVTAKKSDGTIVNSAGLCIPDDDAIRLRNMLSNRYPDPSRGDLVEVTTDDGERHRYFAEEHCEGGWCGLDWRNAECRKYCHPFLDGEGLPLPGIRGWKRIDNPKPRDPGLYLTHNGSRAVYLDPLGNYHVADENKEVYRTFFFASAEELPLRPAKVVAADDDEDNGEG